MDQAMRPWRTHAAVPEPGADGTHQVQTPSGQHETYVDLRGLEAPFSHHDVCGTCRMRLGAASEAGLADRKRQHLRDSTRCRQAEDDLRLETSSAPDPQNVRKADSSTLRAPAKGSAALEALCQCCGRAMPASSMAEVEAAQAAHLGESRRCANWAVERSMSETFKVRSRKTD